MHKIPSSFVYFLSGITTSVAVTLITTLATTIVPMRVVPAVIVCAVFWFLLSFCLAAIATILEKAKDETGRLASNNLDSSEVDALGGALLKKGRQYIVVTALTIASVLFLFGGVGFSFRVHTLQKAETTTLVPSPAPPPTPAQPNHPSSSLPVNSSPVP